MAAITQKFQVDVTVTDDAEFEDFEPDQQEAATRALFAALLTELNRRAKPRRITFTLQPSDNGDAQALADLLELGLMARGVVGL